MIFSYLSKFATLLLVVFLLFNVVGCMGGKGLVVNKFEPPKQEKKVFEKRYNGAIYQSGMPVSMFEDTTARRVGDIITITLVEAASALSSAGTKAEKTQNVEMPAPTVAGGGVTKDGKNILENKIEAGRDFKGSGESNQAHNFQAVIAVSVVDVLPNSYLVVRGEKLIMLNQSEEYIRFSGIVRPQDISLDNKVESQKVANVRISYAGTGVLSTANKMGTLARFFQNPAYPF